MHLPEPRTEQAGDDEYSAEYDEESIHGRSCRPGQYTQFAERSESDLPSTVRTLCGDFNQGLS